MWVTRVLRDADELFFTAALAGGAFAFGHLIWAALFAFCFAVDLALRGRRILRQRSERDPEKQAEFDKYFAKPS